jgi:hypothetical protein
MNNHSSEEEKIRWSDTITFDKRQASWIASGLLLLFVVTFATGYFFGKRRAAQEFAHKIMNDSFGDQAQYTMLSMYSNAGNSLDSEKTSEATTGEEFAPSNGASQQAVEQPVQEEVTACASTVPNGANAAVACQEKLESLAPGCYSAQLAGFGVKQRADEFAARVKKLGLRVRVVRRVSKSSRGKILVWYQVVTESYHKESELQRLINIVSKAEHIKNIRIRHEK